MPSPCSPTWLGGARCVVAAGIRGGCGGLDGRRGRPGGGFVHADLRFELRKAPSSVNVLKLLNLDTKHTEKKGNEKKLGTRPHFS